jgi:hypothetical protein
VAYLLSLGALGSVTVMPAIRYQLSAISRVVGDR